MKDVTFIRSIIILTRGKFCTYTIFFIRSLVPLEKLRHMTSDFDVCEVDMNMQMSFLNATPCSRKQNVRAVDVPVNVLLRNKTTCHCPNFKCSKRI